MNLAAGKTPIVILLLQAATAGAQPSPSLPMTRAEQESFLLKARIVSETPVGAGVLRVRLADGQREHDASLQASTSDDPSQWGYRCNVAAYELDKALELELVSPSVERTVNGRPAALTWWADDVLMDERSRRRRGVVPPDPESWSRQMQAVRVFDELIANAYRSMNPASYTSTLWDNLLITGGWRIRLIDHVRAFRTSRQLEYPESLAQCDHTLLARLRALSPVASSRLLGRFLNPDQLDALEARRTLIVRHFDERIAREGEQAVLYDIRRPAGAESGGTPMDAAQLREFATRYTAAWCSQTAASVAAFFAETGSLKINDAAPSVGRTAITAAAQGFMTAFPDMVVTLDGIETQGSHAVYRWTLTGTNTGPGGTGKAVRISGYEEWAFGPDGLIAESRGHFDAADYRRQLN